MFDEKSKNEDKPKNEEIRAQLSFYRGIAVLLGIGIVALIVIFVVIPHLFPPAVEAVKYCGDYPCKEEAVMLTDGFKGILDCLMPMVTIGFGFSLATSVLGLLLRMLGGGK